MPEVAVLLPVYNGANYLESSIKSVLAQHCDLELHILDGCSTDATPSIAQSTGDPRVRYSCTDGGAFARWNRGFQQASAPLLRLWAHDDLMLPGSLDSFVRFAHEHPRAGMIYCDFASISAAGERTGSDRRYEAQRDRTPTLADPPLSALLFFCFGCLPGNISTVMLRHDVWEQAGGFREDLEQAPDYDMWLRVSEFAQVGFVREKLIELRDHPLQMSKVGQRRLTTIDEDLMVFKELRRRLNGSVTQREFMGFWRHHRGRQHAHWLVKSLTRGDVALSRRGWRALKQYGQPWRQLLFWLASANGRMFTIDNARFFDTLLPRVTRAGPAPDTPAR